MANQLTEGADVLFRLKDRYGEVVDRPAKVVKVWRQGDGSPPDNGCSNLVVFVDGSNDDVSLVDRPPIKWETSRLYSEEGEAGTWHWPR